MQEQGQVVYSNDLVLSEEQRDADADYGIYEKRKQRLNVNWGAKSLVYEENYYYSCEKGYVEVTNRKKQTDLTGTFEVEGDMVTANVTGKYLHYVKEDSQEKTSVTKPNVKGKLMFMKTEQGVKITEVKLYEDEKQFETYFTEIEFTKL